MLTNNYITQIPSLISQKDVTCYFKLHSRIVRAQHPDRIIIIPRRLYFLKRRIVAKL